MTNLVGELKKKKPVKVKAGFHYPEPIPATEKKNNPARECAHCSRKNGNKRKETRYICSVCPDQPAICVAPCFRLYHQLRQQQHVAENNETSGESSEGSSSESETASDSEDDFDNEF